MLDLRYFFNKSSVIYAFFYLFFDYLNILIIFALLMQLFMLIVLLYNHDLY